MLQIITAFEENNPDPLKRFVFPNHYKWQAETCPECKKALISFWIEEGNGINNLQIPHKYIIKAECHYFYNIQHREYYLTNNLDGVQLPTEAGFFIDDLSSEEGGGNGSDNDDQDGG